MSGNKIFAFLLVAASAVASNACGDPLFKFRYKLSIEANINGQVKKASSVAEVAYWLDIDNSSHGSVKGEALYLDLGSSCRPLIALLTARPRNGARNTSCQWGENGPGCLHDLYGTDKLDWNDKARRLDGGEALLRQRGARALPIERLPDLVTFEDITDPATVKEVSPNDPSKALGCDFGWQKITLEITDEPVTTGIEKKLSWLPDYYDKALDGRRPGQRGKEMGLASEMSTVGFQMGMKR
ncbi:MAG: hypothetical protein HOP09_02915 [Hyphomicrobium sp.]|nr:hypothetical protein [Hyphomicrobium sp.]